MTKKVFTAILAIGLVLLSSCSHKIDIAVINIHKVNRYIPQSLTYYLPKTKLIIELQLTKISEHKGPFADYTDELVGNVQNIIRQDRTYWQITDIKIRTAPIRDTNNIWLITGQQPWIYMLQLTPEGFPISLNLSGKNNYTPHWEEEKLVEQPTYKTVTQTVTTIDRGYKEVYDTIFQIQRIDTIQRIVPIIQKKVIKKSTREQAQEIANKIFTLRDDREALLVGEGDSEYLPDGQALTVMLKGIDQLEQQYLSLFTGRIDKTSYHYKYQTVPDIKNSITKTIIFRFSPKYGLLPITDMRGKPVYLEIETLGTTNPIKNFIHDQDLLRRIEKLPDNNHGLAYRIPEIAIVRIKLDNKLLAKKQILLPQAGTVARLPLQLIKYQGIQIEFDPYTGAIRSINLPPQMQ